jgi:hypothetical protein
MRLGNLGQFRVLRKLPLASLSPDNINCTEEIVADTRPISRRNRTTRLPGRESRA